MLNHKCYQKYASRRVRDAAHFSVPGLTKQVIVFCEQDRGFLLQDPNPTQK